MSFILDALKKSENERQKHSDTEFTTVPSSPDVPTAPRWLWILGGLLALNIVVVIGLTLRSGSSPNPTTSQVPIEESSLPTRSISATNVPDGSQAASASTEDEQSFSSQVAAARRNQPQQSPPTPSPAPTATPARQPEYSPVSVGNLPVSERANLPSLMELRANGTLQLPDLHIDIHVYDTDPANRFAFINMNKYSENSTLDEGPLLREITTDGVILEYRGHAFILPRE